jgi:hypothetical protein
MNETIGQLRQISERLFHQSSVYAEQEHDETRAEQCSRASDLIAMAVSELEDA